MEEKHKELITYIVLTIFSIGMVFAWTSLFIWIALKIPYIGIPVAILFGISGIMCLILFINGGRLCYLDWKKKYSSSL